METTLPARRPARGLRLLAAPLTAALVLLGIWLAGGVITDDFRTSMGLSALWFAIVAVAAVVVWRRAPALRWPVSAVAAATIVAAGGFLALTSVRDRTVNEQVVTGPALASGSFAGLAHDTVGTARIVAGKLTLTGFRTSAGPDLFVYLVPGETDGRDVDGGLRLGRLKGNIGNQQYDLPPGAPVGATVVVWCRAFSVAFGAARLQPV